MTVTRPDGAARAEPWTLPPDVVAHGLGIVPDEGLSGRQAATLLAAAGTNEVVSRGRRPAWRLVFAQLTDTMILVLLAAAVLTAAIGDLADMTGGSPATRG